MAKKAEKWPKMSLPFLRIIIVVRAPPKLFSTRLRINVVENSRSTL